MSRYYSLPSRIWGEALKDHYKPTIIHFFKITNRIAITWERRSGK